MDTPEKILVFTKTESGSPIEYQTFPDTTEEDHIVVDDEVTIKQILDGRTATLTKAKDKVRFMNTKENEQYELPGAKLELMHYLDEKFLMVKEQGYLATFPDGEGHVQLRDKDMPILDSLLIKTQYSKADQLIFRDAENVNHLVPKDILAVIIESAKEMLQALQESYWILKDMIQDITDPNIKQNIKDSIDLEFDTIL